jgi:hypothetical protein
MDSLRVLLLEFANMFGPCLDDKKMSETKSNEDLFNLLNKRQKLSRVEYLILFSIFLNFHKLVSRVNFIVDITALEDS